jgi:hypothetical protein
MNIASLYQLTPLIAVIEEAGVPALRIAFSVALLGLLYGGVLIFRKRHRFGVPRVVRPTWVAAISDELANRRSAEKQLGIHK